MLIARKTLFASLSALPPSSVSCAHTCASCAISMCLAPSSVCLAPTSVRLAASGMCLAPSGVCLAPILRPQICVSRALKCASCAVKPECLYLPSSLVLVKPPFRPKTKPVVRNNSYLHPLALRTIIWSTSMLSLSVI